MIKRWGPLIVAPLLGILAMILPVVLGHPAQRYDAPLFPIVRTAVEGVGFWQLLLLILVGVALGAVSNLRSLALGLTAVLLLPIVAVAEMFADPTSHNMWPFEFVFYGFYGCVVSAGAAAIHEYRRRRPGSEE